MVKHAESQHTSHMLNSSMCRIENATGEGGNGIPPHKIHFPWKKLKTLSLVSATLQIEYATQFLVVP